MKTETTMKYGIGDVLRTVESGEKVTVLDIEVDFYGGKDDSTTDRLYKLRIGRKVWRINTGTVDSNPNFVLVKKASR